MRKRSDGWVVVSACLLALTLALLGLLLWVSGNTVTIALDSNATTGYQWSYIMEGDGALYESDYAYKVGFPLLPGSGGQQIWKFLPERDGEVMLIFTLPREKQRDPRAGLMQKRRTAARDESCGRPFLCRLLSVRIGGWRQSAHPSSARECPQMGCAAIFFPV